MKKILTLSLLAILFICCASIFSACRSDETTSDIFSASQDNEIASDMSENLDECGFTFKTLTVENTTVYGSVANSVDTFSFIDEIETTGNTNFIVSLDIYGIQSSATKTIPLEVGDNTVYIIEMKNDIVCNIYTVTIRRRKMCTVVINSYDWSTTKLTVEEGTLLADMYTPQKLGCKFLGWDYDLSQPIMQDTTINALWEIDSRLNDFHFSAGTTSLDIEGVKKTNKTHVVIPDFATGIWFKNFQDNHNPTVTSLTIPKSVTYINASSRSWGECFPLLENIYYEGTLEDWCKITFSETSSGSSNPIYSSYYHRNLYINGKLLEGELIIPENISVIKSNAFCGFNQITKIRFSENITKIESGAFSCCDNIAEIILPDSLEYLADTAFYSCDKLKSVKIGEGVKFIGRQSFSYCNIEKMIIPNNIETMEYYILHYGSLKSLFFKGTIQDWTAINIDSNNAELFTAEIYYYSEEEPKLNANGTAYDGNYWHYDEYGEIVVWEYTKE